MAHVDRRVAIPMYFRVWDTEANAWVGLTPDKRVGLLQEAGHWTGKQMNEAGWLDNPRYQTYPVRRSDL